jgi:hypothetical protein
VLLTGHSILGEVAANGLLLDAILTDNTTAPVVFIKKSNQNGPGGKPVALALEGNCNNNSGGDPGILDVRDSNPVSVTPTGNLITARGSNGSAQITSFVLSSRGDGAFAHDLAVTGTLSKGAGTFHIDHPVDPDNKDLVHGFVESPRYDLLYRGIARLRNGQALVSIDEASSMSPGTFAALTRNAQGEAWNESDDENNFERVRLIRISNGRALIKSENPSSNIQVGWVVFAERNDPYVYQCGTTDQDGHLRVEIEKAEPSAEDQASLQQSNETVATADAALVGTTITHPAVAGALLGKKGYPRHASALGRQDPTRSVSITYIEKRPDGEVEQG